MKIVFILVLLVLVTFERGHPEFRRNKEGRFLGLGIKSKVKNAAEKLFGLFRKSKMKPEYAKEPELEYTADLNRVFGVSLNGPQEFNIASEYAAEPEVLFLEFDRRTSEPELEYTATTEPNRLFGMFWKEQESEYAPKPETIDYFKTREKHRFRSRNYFISRSLYAYL